MYPGVLPAAPGRLVGGNYLFIEQPSLDLLLDLLRLAAVPGPVVLLQAPPDVQIQPRYQGQDPADCVEGALLDHQPIARLSRSRSRGRGVEGRLNSHWLTKCCKKKFLRQTKNAVYFSCFECKTRTFIKGPDCNVDATRSK